MTKCIMTREEIYKEYFTLYHQSPFSKAADLIVKFLGRNFGEYKGSKHYDFLIRVWGQQRDNVRLQDGGDPNIQVLGMLNSAFDSLLDDWKNQDLMDESERNESHPGDPHLYGDS